MDEFMDEFMDAMKEVFPNLLVQFEDFSTDNAFKYLSRFRQKYRCFNDDVSALTVLLIHGAYVTICGSDPGYRCSHTVGPPECGTSRICGLW
jgi:hypothetical protein